MSAGKLIKIFGARAKIETTYNTSSSPANTDAILLSELPDLKVGYANDGARPMPPGTMGTQLRAAPSGRTGETTLKFEPRGAAAAYSASVLPNIHPIMRACGFDAVVVTTSGLETVTYTPTPGPTGFASVSADLFARAQQYSLTGVFGDLTIGAVGPVVPTVEVAIKGVLASITDVALTGSLLSYGTLGSIIPPKAINVAFTVNGVSTLKLKSWQYKLNRAMGVRLNQNAGGHAGWSIGSRGPTFEFEVENPALSTIDFHTLRDAGTQFAIALTLGTVQYNKWGFSTPSTCQILDVSDAAEDPTATVKVKCQINPSALGSNDDGTFLFN